MLTTSIVLAIAVVFGTRKTSDDLTVLKSFRNFFKAKKVYAFWSLWV